MTIQTSITQAPVAAVAGKQDGLDKFHDVRSCVVEQESSPAGIDPGLFLVRGTGGDRTVRVPVAVPAANPDAFKLAIATSGSEQILGTGGTAFDGDGGVNDGSATADARIYPPRKVTITRNNHADHNAVVIVVAGDDHNGVAVSESIQATDGGNETLTTSTYFSRLTSVTIPAQAGTGGTTSVGLSASFTLEGLDAMGVSLLSHKALDAQATDGNQTYEHETQIPVLRRGYVWVDCETACAAGERAYVRAVAAGAEKRGAFRAGGTDSGDCVPVDGCRFVSSLSGAGVALLEVDL